MSAAFAASVELFELSELSELSVSAVLVVSELEEALCSQLFEDNSTDSRS